MAGILAGQFDVLRGFILHTVKHAAVDLGKPTIDLEFASDLGYPPLLSAKTETFSPSDRPILPALFNLTQLECLSILDTVGVGSDGCGEQKSNDRGRDLLHDILLSCGSQRFV